MFFFSIVLSSIFVLPLNSYAIEQDVFTIFAVNCEDKVELLDYKEFYSMNPSFNYDIEGKTTEELMNKTFLRLDSFAQGRSIVFQHWFDNISKKVKFVRNVNLGQHTDNLGFIEWKGCQVEQLAKGMDINNEGKTLIINRDLWERMDSRSQVGVYLNYFLNLEYILYRLNEDSVNTRYFNGLLSSSQFKKIEPRVYPNIYENILDFNKISFYGMFFEIRGYASSGERGYSVEFDSQGKLVRGKLTFDDFHFFNNIDLIKLKFTNAPGFLGEMGSLEEFRPDLNGDFLLKSYRTIKEHLCLGTLKLEPKKYLNLKLNFKEGKTKIINASGLFRYQDKVYRKIVFKDKKFKVLESSQTEIRNEYREIKIGICE